MCCVARVVFDVDAVVGCLSVVSFHVRLRLCCVYGVLMCVYV